MTESCMSSSRVFVNKCQHKLYTRETLVILAILVTLAILVMLMRLEGSRLPVAVATPMLSRPNRVDAIKVARHPLRMHRLQYMPPRRLRKGLRSTTLRDVVKEPRPSRKHALRRRSRASLLLAHFKPPALPFSQRAQHGHVVRRHGRLFLRHLLRPHGGVLPEQILLLRLSHALLLELLLHPLLRLLLSLQLRLLRASPLHRRFHLSQLIEELRQIVDNRGNRVVPWTRYASRRSRNRTVFGDETLVVLLDGVQTLTHAVHHALDLLRKSLHFGRE